MNSSAIIVFVNWLIHGNELRSQIWSEKGLSNDAWFIMIGNVFIGPMSNFFNPFHFIRWFKQWNISSQIKGGKCKLTQKEANFWFQGPPFDIAQRYANHIKTLMISLFFVSILPLSLPLGMLAVFVHHTTEKYLLLKRHAAPTATGSKLNFAMYKFFDVVLITFAVTNIFFLIFLDRSDDI